MATPPDVTELAFQGPHSTLRLRRPAPGVVVLVIEGTDIGEHGSAPFDALALDVLTGPLHLFVDARHSRGVAVDVSSEWRRWLSDHRSALRSIHMLTGSRFVHVTATFVKHFADLGDLMRIYTHASHFEEELAKLTPSTAAVRG
jgi:hypothetical protein